MAEKILIMGESGTGKSTSIRNCDPSITAIINPVGKPLPFRGSKKFTTLSGVTDSDQICEFMKAQAKAGKKIIVVDDFQYILAIPYMNRIKETGWDKYNDFGSNYFNIIDICNELPEDVCVYYMTHTETLENGLTTVKLIGKLLREKITVEGLFTIVLKTGVSEGKYYFFTQNSGKDTVKSPLGMFDSFSIDNDLSYVDAKIRNYYEFDGAASDEEIAELDTEKAGEVEKPKSRFSRKDKVEAPAATETTTRRSRNEARAEKAIEHIEEHEKILDSIADGREEIPFEEVTKAMEEKDDEADAAKVIEESAEEPEKPVRRTRKSRS